MRNTLGVVFATLDVAWKLVAQWLWMGVNELVWRVAGRWLRGEQNFVIWRAATGMLLINTRFCK